MEFLIAVGTIAAGIKRLKFRSLLNRRQTRGSIPLTMGGVITSSHIAAVAPGFEIMTGAWHTALSPERE